MPIKIPNDLPAFEKLQQEGVRLIGENEALRQDVRPMQVALLNLMPEKPKTETQLARLLGRHAAPGRAHPAHHLVPTGPNTVPLSHLQSFYRTWDDVRERKFDGLIITGAPVEMLPFEEVKYWPELTADPRLVAHPRAQLASTSAGVRRRPSTTSTACPSTPCRPSASACSPTMSASGSTSTAAGPDARLRRLFPGAGLAPHRGPRRRPADRRRARGAGAPRTRRACACCTSPSTARSTCSTTSSTTPTRCTTSSAATGPRAPTSRCRSTTIPTTIRRRRRATAGAPTRTCCSATGSTRCTRPRPTSWRGSAASAQAHAA